jgi:hypothetical protein
MDRKKLLMYGGIGVLVVVLVGAVVGLLMGGRGATVTISDTAVTNVRPTSTTIVWTTKESVVGSVLVSEDGNFPSGMFANYEGMEFYDDRDVSEVEPGIFEVHRTGLIPGYTHHVTIRGLDPEKTYYFALKHEGRIDVLEDNTFTTVPVLGQVYTPDPVYGMLTQDSGLGIADGVVVIAREGMNGKSQLLSTYLAPNGSYSLDVAGAYNEELNGLYLGEADDLFKMEFVVELEGVVLSEEHEVDIDKAQPVGVFQVRLKEDGASVVDKFMMSFVGQAQARSIILDGQEIVIRQEGAPAPPPTYRTPTPPKKDDKKDDTPKCQVSYECDKNNPYKIQENCSKILQGGRTCATNETCMSSNSAAWCQGKDLGPMADMFLADDLIALADLGYDVGAALEKKKDSTEAGALLQDIKKVESIIKESVRNEVNVIVQKAEEEKARKDGICFETCQAFEKQGLLRIAGPFNFLNKFTSVVSAQFLTDQTRNICAELGIGLTETRNECVYADSSNQQKNASQKQDLCTRDSNNTIYVRSCVQGSDGVLRWSEYKVSDAQTSCIYVETLEDGDEFRLRYDLNINPLGITCRLGSIQCKSPSQYIVCKDRPTTSEASDKATYWDPNDFIDVEIGEQCINDMITPVITSVGIGCTKSANFTKCDGNGIVICPLGSIEFKREDCPQGESCNDRTGACEGVDKFPTCAGNKKQGTVECFNGILRRCDHGTWKNHQICDFGCSIDQCNPSTGPDNCPSGQMSDVNTQSCIPISNRGCDFIDDGTRYLLGDGETICIRSVPVDCRNGNEDYRPHDQKECPSNPPPVLVWPPIFPQPSLEEKCLQFIAKPDAYQACMNEDYTPEEIENFETIPVTPIPRRDMTMNLFDWLRPLVSLAQAQGQPQDYEVINVFDDKVLSPGMYEIQYSDTETRTVELMNGGRLTYFYDFNGNGLRDLNEPYVNEAIDIQIKKVAETVAYNLNTGWNLVSFPMNLTGENTSEIIRSSDLLKQINKQGGEATHITTYRGGKFIVFSERFDGPNTITFGTDFNLIPGEAYFIKSLMPSSFTVVGKKVEGSLPVSLDKGWNLVGIYNSAKDSFGGFEVLNQVNSQGILGRILSKWQDGGYQNLIVRDGVEYGNDYQVFPQGGYWIQNAGDSSGVYKPE